MNVKVSLSVLGRYVIYHCLLLTIGHEITNKLFLKLTRLCLV